MIFKRAEALLDGLETKYTALSALTETGEQGRIKGYASRFGEPDQSGDTVMPGAFTASLERLRKIIHREPRYSASGCLAVLSAEPDSGFS